MDSSLLAALPLWVLNLLVAGIVCAQHPGKRPNQTFAVFVLLVVGWSFCVAMIYRQPTEPAVLFWGRLAFASASLIGGSFAAFCQVFPDRQRFYLTTLSGLAILAAAAMAGLSLTPLVLEGVAISGAIHRQYGPLYPLYIAVLLTAFAQGIWTLTRRWRVARGRQRLQIQYLWLGLCLSLSGGTLTNLIIPALTHTSHASAYGPYFSLILVGLTAHAIVRYRLMDIRLVIGRSLTYALAAGLAMAFIWGLFVALEGLFGLQFAFVTPLFPVIVGMTGAAVFHPARLLMQRLLDRYCYRWDYDYRRAIKAFSEVLADLLRPDALCEHLAQFLLDTLQAETVSVYLRHERGHLERRAAHTAHREPPPGSAAFVASPELLALLARAGGPAPQDELARWADGAELQRLHDAFAALGGKVLVPLYTEGQVAALIAIGEKLSGDPFFAHDLEFLATVGHQAGAALKRAQLHEEVAWMHEYNASILRHMESGLVVANHERRLTVVNGAAARMLGLAPGDLLGQPVEALIPHGLGLPLLDTLLGRATYANHQATLTPIVGPALPVALSTSLLQGEAGHAGGAILVVNDLSQIKALEEEKRRIERLASVGAFASGLAHEIKNPLVAIKTLAELLPEQYDDPEFRHTFTTVTLHEVERIDALVKRLRSLSSGSAVPLRPLHVVAPLEETLALLSGELTRRRIEVVRRYAPGLPPILGDHDQLKQVFVNLCLNSLEAMREHGTLTVTVTAPAPRAGQPGTIRIEIADTGPGIPDEHLAQIFDPFFTLKDEGTGLGLAICRGILDYHRGSIGAANRPEGSGAIFTLTLPVAQGVDGYESPVTGC